MLFTFLCHIDTLPSAHHGNCTSSEQKWTLSLYREKGGEEKEGERRLWERCVNRLRFSICSDLKKRGVRNVFIACHDNLKGLGYAINAVFSEAKQQKSVTLVELAEKGQVQVHTVPLVPRHDLREIRGTYLAVTEKSFYDGTATDDYLHISLTDEADVPNALGKLRAISPNLMKLDYDNARTRDSLRPEETADVEHLSPMELFARFFEAQNGRPMTEEQVAFVQKMMEQMWEGEA